MNQNNKDSKPATSTTTRSATNLQKTKEQEVQEVKKGQRSGEKEEEEVKGSLSKNVKVNMESSNNSCDNNVGGGLVHKQAKAAFKIPLTDVWGVAGSTQVKIRTSHTVRILLGLLVVFVITGFILNFRIQSLEERNTALESKLTDIQDYIRTLNRTLAQLQQNVPIDHDDLSDLVRDDLNDLTDEEESSLSDNNTVEEDKDNALKRSKSKRSISASDLAMSIPSGGMGMLHATNVSDITLPMFKNAPATPTQPGPQPSTYGKGSRKRERGNRNKRNETQKHFPKHYSAVAMKKLIKKKDKDIAKLKLKLEAARIRAKSTANLAKTLERQASTALFSRPVNDPRAAYLTVRDPNIKIENPDLELIGPWYISESGKDIGFNDMWYQKLALDDNGTSVVFQESGLYLIYAQVFYKSVLKLNQKPAPMGFRIYLKKRISENDTRRQQLIPIAECVPSFPSTFFQTCFTQICWFVEEGDEVYLEHFTSSFPTIANEKPGQTFMGIVRLSS